MYITFHLFFLQACYSKQVLSLISGFASTNFREWIMKRSNQMWNENCWKQIKIWHDNYLNSIVSSPRSFKHAGYDYMSPYDFYSIVSHKMMKQNGRNQDPTFREVGSEYHVFKIILISCHNYLWELRSFLFFLQKTCACGNHGDSKVIVQF